MQRRLLLLWVCGTAIALGVGGGLAEIVSAAVASENGLHNLLSSPRWQVAVGVSFGAPVLVVQCLILWGLLSGSIQWLARAAVGLVIGAAVGAFVGLAAAMVTLAVGSGCEFTSSDACMSGVFALMFPVAGCAAGAVAGVAMGVALRLSRNERLQDWTWPMARAWAGIGATFWTLAPLLLRKPVSDAGLLDTDATLATVALTAVAGVASGLVGGMLSAGHVARMAGRE